MRINESQLRKIIRTEVKTKLFESDVTQGLENVVNQAKSQLENKMESIVQDAAAGEFVHESNEFATKAALEAAADYLGMSLQEVQAFYDNELVELDEEMNVYNCIVESVVKFAAAVAQEYLNIEDDNYQNSLK